MHDDRYFSWKITAAGNQLITSKKSKMIIQPLTIPKHRISQTCDTAHAAKAKVVVTLVASIASAARLYASVDRTVRKRKEE